MLRKFVVMALAIGLTAFAAPAAPRKPVQPPPLVNLAPAPIETVEARATWNFGGWQTGDFGTFTMASTLNESRSAFGAVCGKDCVWFVNFQIECTAGHEYPAMINSPAGSFAIKLRCYHLGNYRLLTFPMDERSLGLFNKPGEAGFAIPLESGKFGVSRFSLTGGPEAVEKAIDVIVDRRKSNQEGLRDFTI